MDQGITFLAILHIIVALLLVTVVLIQDSKGGGVGGAFGGGSSQSLFGATGAVNFLVKVTRTLAIVFMITCVALTIIISRRSGHSAMDKLGDLPPAKSAPAAPATASGASQPTQNAAPAAPAPQPAGP